MCFRVKLRESETRGLEEPLPSFILPSRDQIQIPAPKGPPVVGRSWGLERRQAGTQLHIPGPKPRNPDSDSNQSLPGGYESVYVCVEGQIIILSSQSLTLPFRLDMQACHVHLQALQVLGTGPENIKNRPESKHRRWFCVLGCRCLLSPKTFQLYFHSPVFAFFLARGFRSSVCSSLSSFIWFRFMSPSMPSPSCFICVYFCLIPTIPLGSHLHQCHSFPSQSRGLHTKLPICTLPALSGIHGRGGPAEHAPADGSCPDLRPARPLPASAHRVSTRLPR